MPESITNPGPYVKNSIPPITAPLGRNWDQPNPSDILIDDTHAVMEDADFRSLHEYSSTNPSGVYHGKMWKARARRQPDGEFVWFLRWFDICDEDPSLCRNEQREILIA